MASNTLGGKNKAVRNFYDFTLFSEVVVRPGARLTPRTPCKWSRIIPLRKRVVRYRSAPWDRPMVFYIEDAMAKVAKTTAQEQEPSVETERSQWGAQARRARLSWMDENPY